MARLLPLLAYVSVACLSSISGVSAATYALSDAVVGDAFYDFFDWQTGPDPSQDRVQYVDQPTAQSLNLTYADGNTFLLRTEATSVLDPAGPGRSSIKLRSKKTYTNHVAVFDVRHLPQGCGTWPSIWEADEGNWPNGGEIDIVEGVNDQGANTASLHTLPGCSMPESRIQTGGNTQLDCDFSVNDNAGCGVRFNPTSYGPSFNENGGGWYLLERTPDYIKVWFWDRGNTRVPLDVRNGGSTITTDNYGRPVAQFPNTQCDIEQFFKSHHLIINLNLCGDKADGAAYGSAGCPGTCVDLVNNNPAAFTDAYFDFASIRIYQ